MSNVMIQLQSGFVPIAAQAGQGKVKEQVPSADFMMQILGEKNQLDQQLNANHGFSDTAQALQPLHAIQPLNVLQNPADSQNTVAQDPILDQIIQSVAKQEIPVSKDMDSYAEFATTSQMISAFQSLEINHSQALNGEIEANHFKAGPSVDQSVLYLLHWISSGHLSYVDSSANCDNAAVNQNSSATLPASSEVSEKLSNKSALDFVSSDNTELLGYSGEAVQIGRKTDEKEPRSSVIDAATSVIYQQASPYLKRRIFISTQDTHTTITIRDYFQTTEQNLSELKLLLLNAKRTVPGNIKLTINGQNYGYIKNNS